MTRVINIQHWLDEDGAPARPVRKQALRVARLIEYGGPLEAGQIDGGVIPGTTEETGTDGTAPVQFFRLEVRDGRALCNRSEVGNSAGGKEHGLNQRGLPGTGTGDQDHISE